MESQPLCTPAWLFAAFGGSEPGVLELADGRIAFTSADGRVFEAPASEVEAAFPWYYFGGGMKLKIGGKGYGIAFVRPNDAADIPGHLFAREGFEGAAGDRIVLLTAGRKVRDVGQGRAAGKAWREVLAKSAV